MPSLLEKKISQLVEKAERPKIRVEPGHRILPERWPQKRGRPKKYLDGSSIENHAGRRGCYWPKCRGKGCRNYLKVDQAFVCSEDCANEVFNRALQMLAGIGATREEILEVYEDPKPLSRPIIDGKSRFVHKVYVE